MDINSKKVFIYPSGYRQYNNEGTPENVNPESRLNTEFNIVKSINSLVPTINQGENKYKDSGSFIVDYSNNVLEFYVHGYWFKIIDFTAPDTDLYASIKLDNRASENNDYNDLYELCPILTDSEGKNLDKLVDDGGTQVARFIGLSLDTTPHQSATYTLQLFKDGELCVENKAKLTTNDIYDETRNKLISDEFDTNLLHSQFVEANEIITDEINDINLNYSNNNITLSGNNRTVNVPLASTPSTVSYIDQPQTITSNKTINSEFVFHTNGQSDINISGSGISVATNNQSLADHQFIDILYMWGTQYGKNLQILNDGTIGLYSNELATTITPGEIDVDYLISTYDLEVTRYLNNIKFTNTTSNAIDLNAVVSGDICVTNAPQSFTEPKTRTYSGYISTIFPTESSVALSISNSNNTTKYGFNKVTFGDGGEISSDGNNTLTIKNKNSSATSIEVSDNDIILKNSNYDDIYLFNKFVTIKNYMETLESIINERLPNNSTGDQDDSLPGIGVYSISVILTIDGFVVKKRFLYYVGDLRDVPLEPNSQIFPIEVNTNGTLAYYVKIHVGKRSDVPGNKFLFVDLVKTSDDTTTPYDFTWRQVVAPEAEL